MNTAISQGPNTRISSAGGGGGGGSTHHFNQFLTSNNNVTKFAFIILVLIIFIALYHLGVYILDLLLGPKQEVYLTKEINDANQYLVIKQDPQDKGAITVNRSEIYLVCMVIHQTNRHYYYQRFIACISQR